MAWGDLKVNADLGNGMRNCHGLFDFRLDEKGDLLVITDPDECLRQRILLWIMTYKGERVDPTLGCVLHEYTHRPLTSDVLKSLQVHLREELQKLIPEKTVRAVGVTRSGDNQIDIRALIGSDEIRVGITQNELMRLESSMNEAFRAVGFVRW